MSPPAPTSSADDQIAEIVTQSREALAAGDVETAARGFGAVLQMDQEHVGAIAGMAACMLEAGELERAEKLANAVPMEERKDPEVASVFKRLEMAKEVAELGDPVELEARLASNPADHEARIKFAKILNAKGHRESCAPTRNGKTRQRARCCLSFSKPGDRWMRRPCRRGANSHRCCFPEA